MTDREPTGELDARYGSADATPAEWPDARRRLKEAELYWLSTVRPDGRPHVTPLLAVWSGEALYFCTGPEERKARNLERNPHCVLTTGTPTLGEGMDLVVEGDAVRATDDAVLRAVAEEYVAAYGEDWRFAVRDGAFHSEGGGPAYVFEVTPVTAFGFGKGKTPSQTRWRF